MAPLVGVFAAAQFDTFAPSNAVFQLYAIEQLLHMMGLQLAHDAHCIFTFNFKTRMHHAIRKLAGRREKQQAACIEIEAADRNPLSARHRRKALENTRSSARIIAARDFSLRLVIKQHSRQTRA